MLFDFLALSHVSNMSAMEGQWEFFVSSSKSKADSHAQAARFWSKVDTFFGLSLIFLSGIKIFHKPLSHAGDFLFNSFFTILLLIIYERKLPFAREIIWVEKETLN